MEYKLLTDNMKDQLVRKAKTFDIDAEDLTTWNGVYGSGNPERECSYDEDEEFALQLRTLADYCNIDGVENYISLPESLWENKDLTDEAVDYLLKLADKYWE